MARCLRTIGHRPKAWIGAAISAGTSILGSILNKNAQKAALREQQRLENYQNTINSGQIMAQQANLTANAQKAYEEQFRIPYAKGGRKRLRSAVGITDGGVALPVGDDTFLLRGGTHEQVNESGKTGIGINVGGREIEAENNELVDFDNNNLRVFSNSLAIPLKRGGSIKYMTPANAVLAGYNKDKVFDTQQKLNGDSHGIKPKYDIGGSVYWSDTTRPVPRVIPTITLNPKYPSPSEIMFPQVGSISDIAKDLPTLNTKTYKEITKPSSKLKLPNIGVLDSSKSGASFGTADYIGLGVNVLGSILSQSINRSGLSSLRKYAPTRPMPYQAGKLITTYNINPQLSALERQRQQAYRSIDRDTASSVAALERRNDINLTTTLAENDLYNKKYQTEADMLNKDTLNQQEVANKNVEAYNKWRNDYNNYMASIASAKSDSNVAMIQGIGSSIGNFLQQGIDRRQLELNRAAYLATADKGNPQILNSYGLLSNREQRMQLRDAISRKDVDDILYWSNYVSPRWQRKLGL